MDARDATLPVICWVDLRTADPAAAAAFYGPILGWDFQKIPIGEEEPYYVALRGGDTAAGLYALTPAQRQRGIGPHWIPYVCVDDADAAAVRAEHAGGRVLLEPTDIGTRARVAVLRDPAGASFAVWQAEDHPGAGATDGPGAAARLELCTRDERAATEFYGDVFGWRPQPAEAGGPCYATFFAGREPVAGMLQMDADWGPCPSHWHVYFIVKDLAEALERARGAGARLVGDPVEAPGVARFALIEDPQGAQCSLIAYPPA
jgi:uncharacterized protein